MLTWQSYQNTEVTFLSQGTEISKTLAYLSSLLSSIKNPLGTRENPARICKDLLSCQYEVSDGESFPSESQVQLSHFQTFEICNALASHLCHSDQTSARPTINSPKLKRSSRNLWKYHLPVLCSHVVFAKVYIIFKSKQGSATLGVVDKNPLESLLIQDHQSSQLFLFHIPQHSLKMSFNRT